jgi:hypothetical protein
MSLSYITPGAKTEWTDASTGGDKLMDMGGLAAAGVVCGAYLDLGDVPRADMYEFEFFVDGLQSGSGVVGSTVDLFVIESDDGTTFDGRPSTAPTASTQGTITADQLTNAKYVGSLSVFDTTEANNLMQGRFVARLTGRYVAPVVINRTAVSFNATTEHHFVKLREIPIDMQPDP